MEIDAPEWLTEIHERMMEAEQGLRAFAGIADRKSKTFSSEIARLKKGYTTLEKTMIKVYEEAKREGEYTQNISHSKYLQLAQASNEFGTAVWNAIASYQTDTKLRSEALQTAVTRSEQAMGMINRILKAQRTEQKDFNVQVEAWAEK